MNEAEPELPPATLDVVPEELDDQPAAQSEWQRLTPMLRLARQITDADRGALVAVCIEWSRYVEATKQVRKTGMLIKTASGYPMINPYLAIASRSLGACTRLWAELGSTPSSRSRVVTTGPGIGGDAFSEFDQVPTLRH